MGSARIGVRDWALGAGVAAVQVIGAAAGDRAGGSDEFGYALLAAAGLVLAARRYWPLAVLVVTGACAVGSQAAGVEVFAVAYLVAVYAAVRAGRRRATVVTSAGVLVALPLVAVAAGLHDLGAAVTEARNVLELAWVLAAGAAGEALRQAERRADEAERTREESALRRAGEERLHIARELHDSLTHQISVITVQAEVAVHLAQKRGEQVPPTMLAIRDAGREAARELRATLQALRDDDTIRPYGLGQVPDLVERARSTGLDASLTIEGRRAEVPVAVDRAAYRIVQESLTNITRHAGAATASVLIDYRPGAVAIRVDDDGTATPRSAPAAGVGLLGMRERVTALGGRLRAGPRSAGGFTVEAELPVERTS
jgi:signal transduction histidine kinase